MKRPIPQLRAAGLPQIPSLFSCGTRALLAGLVILSLLNPLQAAPEKQVEAYGNSFSSNAQESSVAANPSKAWFQDASLGLFLTWGIHSLMEQQPSWCMLKGHMDRGQTFFHPEKYYSMASKFDPQAYNPSDWLEVAKKAGFTYAVLVTKHHDGYALWPSAQGELNSGKFLQGRDLLRPFVDACRANGLRVGFYFSGVDWFHKDFPRSTDRITKQGLDYRFEGIDYSQWRRWPENDPAEVEKHLNDFYDYAKAQLREILTGYGKIDLLWFDGFPMQWPASLKNGTALAQARIKDIHTMILELQPDIVINNRAPGIPPDFQTPERGDGTFPPDGYHVFQDEHWKRKWEFCNTWQRGGGWGYCADGSPKGKAFNSSAWLLEILAQCRAKGGNLLTNSSPTPNGKQPAGFYEKCAELAAWMAHSRDSLIGACALADDWRNHSEVPVTTGQGMWYLHLFPANQSRTLTLKKLPSEPLKITLLRTGQVLNYQSVADGLTIDVPSELRTGLTDVVAVYWK